MSNDYTHCICKQQQYAVHPTGTCTCGVHPNLDAVHRRNIQLYILAECESEQNWKFFYVHNQGQYILARGTSKTSRSSTTKYKSPITYKKIVVFDLLNCNCSNEPFKL